MDVPFPPNYGGIIDVFYKLKAFHQLGVKIYLHVFGFKNDDLKDLKLYAEEVYFYPINQNPFYIFNQSPISVQSRNGKLIFENLQKKYAPIFFESLKTTSVLNDFQLDNYPKFLRLHNIEQNYFGGLAKSESNFFKKILFNQEAKKYSRYEQILNQFDQVFTLSKAEQKYIHTKYLKGKFVPVFHGNEGFKNLKGKGKYALYHGDLRAADNCKVVEFLIEVFKEIDFPLVIASSTKEKWVKSKIGEVKHIKFIHLIDFKHLQELFMDAHINIAWSFQESGTKLKVVNALFNSRFSVINDNVIDDEKISDLCIKVKTKNELILAINQLKEQCFNASESYKSMLENYLNDKLNAEIILNEIFN
ncbi:hypothetical protein [Empedobacter sedimenti]|uniref:hypothetical protein n=1 Tax=Empedobacter sedimenti TaxID=3042610 RepID=UPI0024A6EEF5|nr:hypothetical protein [Empedobacter sedimenti]